MRSLVDQAAASPRDDAAPAPRGRSRKVLATGRRCLDAVVGLVYLAAWTTANRIACLLGFGRSRLVILYYHSVPAAQRARFARQLDAIRAGADAVVAADFCAATAPGRLLVAITFDDAYVSVIDNALPELAARGMPATVFTPSGMLGARPAWQMEAADTDRFETVATGERLRALKQDLVTIGAHSVSHPRLPELDRDAASAEIGGAKSALTRLLEREVSVFSFPYGEFDDDTVELCRTAAYRFAYHTLPRMLDPADASFLRGRVRVDLSDWTLEFWLKLRGAYNWQRGPREFKRWLRRR
jgi:peptidoglycan/xylan/chitin deacetylase (PgdA/CDA1 family)